MEILPADQGTEVEWDICPKELPGFSCHISVTNAPGCHPCTPGAAFLTSKASASGSPGKLHARLPWKLEVAFALLRNDSDLGNSSIEVILKKKPIPAIISD